MNFLKQIICKFRSYRLSQNIDSGGGKITVTDPWLKVSIVKAPNSEFVLKGELKISPYSGGNAPVYIGLGIGAKLAINGDFILGHGVSMTLSNNASLTFGGKKNESGSGITANTMIKANKKIEIGYDFMCAWDVFITDSDWHAIEGQYHQADVSIGNHVWVANSNNVLKGVSIGNNCIVASNSKVINRTFEDDSLIGGIPGKVLKTGVNWCRDLPPSS